ncbi:hypothetical protein ADUPG1_000416 [Aduncisulcus paluster]|uniref:Uncharacterized protein n=1 Tax=Aduncisulcus paluster TaxID=2918883 RepID=A0ABQ5K686_9EUKA|nr:hypothetical protein ADUPG1_000416 [Aduncisulcus paluster]
MPELAPTVSNSKEGVPHRSVDVQIVKAELVTDGKNNWNFIPIPRDGDDVRCPDLMSLEARDEYKKSPAYQAYKRKKTSSYNNGDYDETVQTEEALSLMLGEENFGTFTHISIPFSETPPTPMKGAYICLHAAHTPPSELLFTFTASNGELTSKKYIFPEGFACGCFFLPIDLPDVVKCEICGKPNEEDKEVFGEMRNFQIPSLLFFREKSPEECKVHEAKEKLWSETPVVSPLIASKKDKVYEEDRDDGRKTRFACGCFFLPIDLPDVVKCEICGKPNEEDKEVFGEMRNFQIPSLLFFREKSPEECKVHEAKEKLWSETPVVSPLIASKKDKVYEEDRDDGRKTSRDLIPIPRDDPKLVQSSLSMVKGTISDLSKESKEYDQSSGAQRILKEEHWSSLSYLSIPFPSPSPLKGAHICMKSCNSQLSLFFTFTNSDGLKTNKKYEFEMIKDDTGSYFLPIDLPNIILCEIEGNIEGEEEKSRNFFINSLVFTMPEEIVVSELLSLLPWEHSKDDIMTKLEKTCFFGGDLSIRRFSSHSSLLRMQERFEESVEEFEDSYQEYEDFDDL